MTKNPKILVVDDSSVAAKLTAKSLEEIGLKKYDIASSGNEAWIKINQAHEQGHTYDVILADWFMPNGSGLELLKKVRGDKKFVSVFFCMITAESETQNIVDAVSEGINAYITKPLTTENLQKKLRAFIA